VTESPAGRSPASQTPGTALLRLVEVMDTLRVNCPWDARQTHRSLAPYLLEECYEALEALEGGDESALRDELGDVLLQVVFHARVAAERTDGTGFDIDDVAAGIVEKLIRRHPHVFGDVQVSGPEDVKRNWDAIKAAERGARGGAVLPRGPGARGRTGSGAGAARRRALLPGPGQALGGGAERRPGLTTGGVAAATDRNRSARLEYRHLTHVPGSRLGRHRRHPRQADPGFAGQSDD